MFVLMTDRQAMSSDVICPGCLMANQQGQPRWQEDRLLCGRRLQSTSRQASEQYECQMGFRLMRVAVD